MKTTNKSLMLSLFIISALSNTVLAQTTDRTNSQPVSHDEKLNNNKESHEQLLNKDKVKQYSNNQDNNYQENKIYHLQNTIKNHYEKDNKLQKTAPRPMIEQIENKHNMQPIITN